MSWSNCTAECDGGRKYRKRNCLNYNGNITFGCIGKYGEDEECNTRHCGLFKLFYIKGLSILKDHLCEHGRHGLIGVVVLKLVESVRKHDGAFAKNVKFTSDLIHLY